MVDMISCKEAYERVEYAIQSGQTPSQNDLLLASIYGKNMSEANVTNLGSLLFDYVNSEEVSGDEIDKYFGRDENALFRNIVDVDNNISNAKLTMLSPGENQLLHIDNSASKLSSVDCSSSIPEAQQEEYTNDITGYSNRSDEYLMTYMKNFVSMPWKDIFAGYTFSEPATNIRNCVLAMYAEGLRRNPRFYDFLGNDIEKSFDEIDNEIERLKNKEKEYYDNMDSKYDGSIIEEKEEIDDDYKYLASHITCLMGLQNGEKLSRFGTGSDGYIIFDFKSKGKTYTARYKKLDNGAEKIYIDKGNGNFEEQVFDNAGNLREKTVRNMNKEVQEEFLENGIKIKTGTENLIGGSLKITKERKFLDGTVIKSEKILYTDYDKNNQRGSIVFDKNITKGKYDFVNPNGEKTGESSVETSRESKNNDKKDIKTAKVTSKSNLKDS